MDRGAWQATVHGVTKSWTRLKQLRMNRASERREGAQLMCENKMAENFPELLKRIFG